MVSCLQQFHTIIGCCLACLLLNSIPQLILMYEQNILYTLNESSSSQWPINKELPNIQFNFYQNHYRFIWIWPTRQQLLRQLTSTLNLRDMFPDYPRMPDKIATNLRAIDQYVHVTSSTNTQPSDKQYFFRISLNDKTILIYTR
ncbi:unnamed protein product [Rotaria socialis]|uniref:Uncharacterized protein n=1 Tax=Rotaria socialis TaxID=392032 RepID=A0A820WZM7_9BILA|nr:unnamed protein product [Rotaria socialis]CAF4819207.1 unnamed protein product [Rotaria socialis]